MGAKRCIRQAAFWSFCLASIVALQAEQLPARVYTTADGLAGDTIECIVQDSRGFIWFCTNEGLSRFDGYQFRNFGTDQGLPGSARDLLETGRGEFWVASPNGVYHFNPAASTRSSKFKLYRPQGRPDFGVLTPDGAGGIWCGGGGGLYHMERAENARRTADEDQWRLRFVDIGMPARSRDDTRVEALLRDRSGVLWIASPSGLYRRLPDGRSEHYTVRDGLPFDHVTSLLQDRQGTLWVGTWDGLGRISIMQNSTAPSVETVSITKVGLKGRVVGTMLESSDGRFWLGAEGLYELLNADGHERLELRATPFGPSSAITALKEDRAGNIWIGSVARGALKMAKHGFVTYTEEDGLAAKNIQSVFEDQQGTLTVVTGPPIEGDPEKWVNSFDGRRFHPVRPNIPRDVKGSIWGWYQLTFQDHKGEWWVPTHGGLFRFRGVSNITGLETAHCVLKSGSNGTLERHFQTRRPSP